jgi:hypothetical protein
MHSLLRAARRRWYRLYYRNPFHRSTRLQVGRVDMGVDYHGEGLIGALGRARILGVEVGPQTGWPGGCFLFYRLLRGPMRGKTWYLAEGVTPLVRAGDLVKKGQPIARFNHDAAPGEYPGIETGWGSEAQNVTLAAATHQTGGVDHADSPAGLAAARFLRRIGAPAPRVPAGPLYPGK